LLVGGFSYKTVLRPPESMRVGLGWDGQGKGKF